MRRYLYGILALSALSFAACTSDEMTSPEKKPTQQTPQQPIEGELLVKFSPYVSDILDAQTAAQTRSGGMATRSGILNVDEVLDLIGTYEIERVFPYDKRTEDRTRQAEMHLWYLVHFDAEHSAKEVGDQLSVLGEVQHVSYNRELKRSYTQRATPLTRATLNAIQKATRAGASTYPFNDDLLPMQWHLINRGDMFPGKAIVDADVQCEQAWQKSTGDPSIIVAVLDEGVMLTHPDLSGNIWVNEDEGNDLREDKDGNGYKGDRNGYNFVNNSPTISWADMNDTGHGTHVAGVIAARNNNNTGIGSIAGGDDLNPGVKIMSCQIFSGNKTANTAGQVRAIKYAADNGAVVLQCSWGYVSGLANGYENQPGFKTEDDWEANCPLERTAFDYFTHNAGSPNGVIEGGIAVFAAGNESGAMAGFPGAASDLVSVAATAADFTPAVYTNYGPGTTISAPGGDQDYYYDYGTGAQMGEIGTILSTLPPHVSETGYGYMEGTSMACPHVSGVVALGLSYAVKIRRHFSAEEFKTLLYANITPIDSYMSGMKGYYRYVTDLGHNTYMELDKGAFKEKMGSGQVNAAKLLNAIDGSGKQLSFPNLYISEGAQTVTVPANYFVGGEQLTYTLQISDQSIATGSVSGNKATFNGVKQGATKATIKASNGIEQAFNITVRKKASGSGWL